MNGQWTGEYAGTNSGLLVVELDDVGDQFVGTALAIDYNRSLTSTECELGIPKGKDKFSIKVPLQPVDRNSGSAIGPADFAKLYPGVTPPTSADIEWEVGSPGISIKWTTDIGTHGQCVLLRSDGNKPSVLEPLKEVTSWAAFKECATNLPPQRFIFRGQENNVWRLRTAFHRTDRASLRRFLLQDEAALHRHLSGITAHRFDLTNPMDHAAFLALVQHHGYPTPLLDWTHSPFIAAYFAFRSLDPRKIMKGQHVRIHVLDARAWNSTFERASVLRPAFLHMTMLEPLAINNVRVVPQQSISVVTNVEDLEKYIQERETSSKKSFLTAIDLPVEERSKAIRELDLMGINAGSLFPGLDGACNQLKERFFPTVSA